MRRVLAAESAAVMGLVLAAVAVYTVVLGLPTLVSGADPGPVPVGVATVMVALGGAPTHRGLRRECRRRWGVPADPPARVLRRLTDGLAGVDVLDRLPSRLVELIAEALPASVVQLWVADDGALRPAAWSPPGPPPEGPPDGTGWPVRADGETLGRLVARRADDGEFSATDRRLLAACADRVGLVLAMIGRRRRLQERRTELAERAAALRESRVRSVDTEQVERRRVERDLHDGAQQHLIALGLGVQLSRRLAGRQPLRSTETLLDASTLARRAAADLGRIGESLHPAALEATALSVALRRTVAGTGLAVTVTAEPSDAGAHLDTDRRAALFFAALEAVQNVAKHAGVGTAEMYLRETADGVTVQVRDGGRGFDPVTVRPGEGTRNTHRRLSEVGGRVERESTPGGGTSVTATVPRVVARPWTAP